MHTVAFNLGLSRGMRVVSVNVKVEACEGSMNIDQEVFMKFMNLHDAFLNAGLYRSYMLKCPVEKDVTMF